MSDETGLEGLWVLDPVAEREPAEASMCPRMDTLENKVLGVLDNGKHNADKILEEVVKIIASRHHLSGVLRRRKPNATAAAPPETLDEMAKDCDFAVIGVGD